MPPFTPRSNESDDDNVDEHLETVNRLKRRISELESQEKKAQSKSNPALQVYVVLRNALHFFACLSPLKKILRKPRACYLQGCFNLRQCESLIAEDDCRRDLEDARTLGDQVHGEEEVPTTEFVSFSRSLPIL
jgi:hypothetical protein